MQFNKGFSRMDVVYFAILEVTLALTAYGQNNTFVEYKRLYKHLEENMENKIRPLRNQSKAITVNIDVHLQAIQGLNEKEQLLESTLAISCSWNYETLAWNTSEFSGIMNINNSPKDAWIPALIVSNAIDSLVVLAENRIDINGIAVLSNGDATWFTGGHLRTSCHIDITKYPFDTQTCVIVISKIVPDSEVKIAAPSGNVTKALYEENGEWSLKSSVVKTRVLYGYTTFLDSQLILKRHSLFYILNGVIPVALLSFMTVLCFKIPPASGERLSYSISLLLTFVVLLNLISDSMPRVPKHVSYLQLYVNYQLTMAVLITTLSIMLVNMSYPKDQTDVPCIIKFFYRCYSFRKRTKAINSEGSEESTQHKTTGGIPKTKAKSCTETVSSSDRLPVIQYIGDALFWIFMTMLILSTVLFFILVSI